MTSPHPYIVVFDNEAFSADINSKAFIERRGMNELAAHLGLSASTLYRICTHRKDPSVNSLVVLLNWLQKPFEYYTRAQ